MHRSQILALALMVFGAFVAVEGASVVRVPRVYNILIKSDGALAPSEAVSADAQDEEVDEVAEQDEGEEEEDGEERGNAASNRNAPVQPPLPVLNAKDGAVQEGVNYTEVPLSRAYPLTRYTAPIIAAHYPFPYLHGGLILGPVPKAAAPQKVEALQARPLLELEDAPERPIQQLPLPQYRASQRSDFLPQGAYDDEYADSVRVEAQEEEEA